MDITQQLNRINRISEDKLSEITDEVCHLFTFVEQYPAVLLTACDSALEDLAERIEWSLYEIERTSSREHLTEVKRLFAGFEVLLRNFPRELDVLVGSDAVEDLKYSMECWERAVRISTSSQDDFGTAAKPDADSKKQPCKESNHSESSSLNGTRTVKAH